MKCKVMIANIQNTGGLVSFIFLSGGSSQYLDLYKRVLEFENTSSTTALLWDCGNQFHVGMICFYLLEVFLLVLVVVLDFRGTDFWALQKSLWIQNCST